jgi:hypothetical protein
MNKDNSKRGRKLRELRESSKGLTKGEKGALLARRKFEEMVSQI